MPRGRKNSPANNPGGGPRKMAEVELKRYEALSLYVEGHLSQRAIGERLGVGKSRAGQLIHEAMREAREERRSLADFAMDRELGLIEMEIREMVEILARPCDVCKGVRNTDVKQCSNCMGLKDLGGEQCEVCQGMGVVTDEVLCKICARTGCFYDPDTRLKSIDRIQRSSDRRAKLLGLYAPEKIDLPVDRDFYADLERMPDDELDRELRAFQIGVKTGKASEPAREPDE